MEILDLGGNSEENIPAPKRKKNKNLKLALGAGTLAVMVGLGSTLAANISLNSGGPVEFGQGVAQTISCQTDLTASPSANSDRSVTVTPISDFVNTGDGLISQPLSSATMAAAAFETRRHCGDKVGC